MKKVMLVAAVAALAATAAHAGSMAPPVVEPAPMVETATSSSSVGIIVPLLFLVAIGAAIWLL